MVVRGCTRPKAPGQAIHRHAHTFHSVGSYGLQTPCTCAVGAIPLSQCLIPILCPPSPVIYPLSCILVLYLELYLHHCLCLYLYPYPYPLSSIVCPLSSILYPLPQFPSLSISISISISMSIPNICIRIFVFISLCGVGGAMREAKQQTGQIRARYPRRQTISDTPCARAGQACATTSNTVALRISHVPKPHSSSTGRPRLSSGSGPSEDCGCYDQPHNLQARATENDEHERKPSPSLAYH